MEHKIPRTTLEFTQRYRSSAVAQRMQKELDEHLANTVTLEKETLALQTVIQNEKEPRSFKAYPEKMNFGSQVKTALRREYRQRWGDQWCVTYSLTRLESLTLPCSEPAGHFGSSRVINVSDCLKLPC